MTGGLVVTEVTVRHGDATVLDHADLSATMGAWVGLIGPNGAGKSTLLRTIAGHRPTRGGVRFGGVDLLAVGPRQRARTVAVVPQHPERPAGMPVIDYVLLGRSAYVPHLGAEGHRDLTVATELLARLDLEDLATRPVSSLSGGEFQRAVLARALAQQAPLLLLDEPTSSLDIGHAQQVLELVDQLRRERGLTVVSALHDLTTAGQFSDELVLLHAGRVVARGAPGEVLRTEALATYYEADVRVVRDPLAGRVVVTHRRSRPGPRAGGRA